MSNTAKRGRPPKDISLLDDDEVKRILYYRNLRSQGYYDKYQYSRQTSGLHHCSICDKHVTNKTSHQKSKFCQAIKAVKQAAIPSE
jgi:hypothetical protein